VESIRLSTLLATTLLLAGVAAVDLTSVTGTADIEDLAATGVSTNSLP
jgi:hypothetical protein